MRIGIDASNIRAGGGLTHLSELLRAARPEQCGISRVTVWGGQHTINRLPRQPWLDLVHEPALDESLLHRLLWQRRKLTRRAESACDLLFVPGGTYTGNFRPFVTMSQNLLPFDGSELRRFLFSKMAIRLILLRLAQSKSFGRADGVIFLSEYARSAVKQVVKLRGCEVVIPHGIDERFRMSPKTQRAIETYSSEEPLKLLYVSAVHAYKHQWHVAEAISELRKKSLPILLELIGPPVWMPSVQHLRNTMARLDPEGKYIRYVGGIPYQELHDFYHDADIFIFASSCENMPNILVEAMTAGLPIACSDRGPMPEILDKSGVYFNPEDPQNIAQTLHKLILSPDAREQYASSAHTRSLRWSWERCAHETFSFLAEMARGAAKQQQTIISR